MLWPPSVATMRLSGAGVAGAVMLHGLLGLARGTQQGSLALYVTGAVATVSAWRLWWQATPVRWAIALAAATASLAAMHGPAGSSNALVRLYPVLVNAGLLLVFLQTLRRPPSMIERLARRNRPDLPPHAVAYTRRVTWVWCVFFAFNGAIAAATGLWCSDTVWALYNGAIAYGLMAILGVGECLVRRRVATVGQHG